VPTATGDRKVKTFTTEEIYRIALAQVKEEKELVGKEHAKIADEVLNRFMTSLIAKAGK
jgi:hypothetical protein